jgi:hypothetical protein
VVHACWPAPFRLQIAGHVRHDFDAVASPDRKTFRRVDRRNALKVISPAFSANPPSSKDVSDAACAQSVAPVAQERRRPRMKHIDPLIPSGPTARIRTAWRVLEDMLCHHRFGMGNDTKQGRVSVPGGAT